MPSHQDKDIDSLSLYYDLSSKALEMHDFRPEDALFERVVQTTIDDPKMQWLRIVIEGIMARDVRIMRDLQTTNNAAPTTVDCKGECQLEKMVVVVQDTFVQLMVTAALQ
ncbi:uncharacterized protein SETTUDRAFT_32051 [Exserohilum turcica Et28A]|uniref:Uncharacterized protein n=1 Tax=Exserohilum turcicum (strain 28A) TaxID=671987 RepID=R0K963_EXST2|nr:uncharacterized protein SETTUDRAFT_32051 [Exserohilum turcica Et28A]EOA84812.1 hypothetical protein SETTUDRAFT_32051 [Exserohilum turcica Et28A]